MIVHGPERAKTGCHKAYAKIYTNVHYFAMKIGCK